jgi:hypothetical protein
MIEFGVGQQERRKEAAEEPPAARVADPGPVRFHAALLKRQAGLDPGFGFLHPLESACAGFDAGEGIKYSVPGIL